MLNKFWVSLILVLTLIAVGFFWLNHKEEVVEQTTISSVNNDPRLVEQGNIEFQARFLIFTNGTKRDFSGQKYHDRNKSVLITAADPSVIYVKTKGITWQNFFDSLPSPMKVENDCLYTGTGHAFCNSESHSLKFFLNSKKVDQVLEMEIRDGDKLLISFGPKDENIDEQIKLLNLKVD